MPYSMGLDVGLVAVKGVLLDDGKLVAQVIRETGVKPGAEAATCFEQLLREARVGKEKIQTCAVTGWGAKRVSLDLHALIHQEVACLAKGAKWLCPTSRTVVDMGAQIVKAARFDEKAKVKRYDQSDKCAAGAGRFLDIMSAALELEVHKLAEIGASSERMMEISSQCSVFGESEIISYVNTGMKVEDIVNGINYSIAKRVSTIIMRLGFQEDVVVTGGVAKNGEVIRYLEDMLGIRFSPYEVDPQMIGAIGAGLMAWET